MFCRRCYFRCHTFDVDADYYGAAFFHYYYYAAIAATLFLLIRHSRHLLDYAMIIDAACQRCAAATAAMLPLPL